MANWKKILVSGSNAELNSITGSNLQLTNLQGTSNTIPLVIDSEGNVSTGSAYALTPGGDGSSTIGGSNLLSNVVILGDGNASIKNSSTGLDADFNSANVKGITDLTASVALIETLKIGSKTSAGITAFQSSSTGLLEIPSSNGFEGFDINIPVTMSNVPNGGIETDVLVIGSNGEVMQRPSSELGGVTGVNGGTNITVNQSTGGVTASLDDNISLTSITASGTISASGTITAPSIEVVGNLNTQTLSFSGINFIETNVATITGSMVFGSGSSPSDVAHEFTGSVSITGSNLTLIGGDLIIPNEAGDGIINVASVLASTATATNVTTTSTFNAFSSSIYNHTASVNISLASINLKTGSLETSTTSLNLETGSINTSLASINLKTGSIDTSITALNNFTGSTFISSSVEGDAQGQIKLNNVNIDINNLGSGDSPTFNNLTLSGDLTVLGNTTTISAQDLVVEDRFIYIGSGSSTTQDIGIVFSSGSQASNEGRLLYYDASTTRFATAKNFDSDATDEGNTVAGADETGNLMTVRINQSSQPSSAEFGEGEMYIDNNDDLWFYVD